MTWWVSSWKHKIRLSKCSSHRESVRQAQNLIARWKMNNARCKRKQEWLAICGSLQCCFVVKRTKIKVVNKDTILLWRDTEILLFREEGSDAGGSSVERDEMRWGREEGNFKLWGTVELIYLHSNSTATFEAFQPSSKNRANLNPPVLQNQTRNLSFPPWPNSQLRENTICNSFGLQFSEFKW